jgi:hypothetical protein
MGFDKVFKITIIVLFVLAIFIYGMSNRYQFFHISNSLTGIACDHYTGKCEWLSPEEMGVEKIMKYSEKQRETLEKRIVPQAPAPENPKK